MPMRFERVFGRAETAGTLANCSAVIEKQAFVMKAGGIGCAETSDGVLSAHFGHARGRSAVMAEIYEGSRSL